ncbi:Y-family DNA polymerase [Thalassotalea sp. PLHSN55]|uniref:Y-family DNA polymerase n=1 Tax=Thalassotalea sp. PLHSN55 TaxID=3435888 RepID=UPI003F832CF1
MTLWLYLHFPALQLDVMYQQAGKEMQPLVIFDDKINEVVQLNAPALSEGVKLGMGLGTASSLCRSLQVKPYQQSTENRALKRIAHWLYSITADITLYPPNGLLLKVTSMLTLYQDLAHYWQQLSQHLQPLNLHYQYATGYSPYAARILARQGLNGISDDEQALLRQIKLQPLACSDLASQVITRLHKVGVRHFADLLVLSFTELAARFDVEVVNYIGRLTGQIQHPVTAYIPPEHFEHYLELYYEVVNLQHIEKPLLKQYRLLEQYLRLKDKLAAALDIVFHQRDADDFVLVVSAAEGEYQAEKWLQLSQLALESVTLTAPVTGLTLKVKRLMSKYAQRRDLFQGAQGSVSAKGLISILSAKLGEERVKGITTVQDDRPEFANQLCTPFSTEITSRVEQKLRPSVLLPSPLPLNEQVQVIPYPERIVTGWWDNHQVARDYFIARSQQGRWLWLFRDNHQRWFVHGVFS